MGKLRFGVAFAVTGKELEGVTPDLTLAGRGTKEEGTKKEASPEGGGNGGGELGKGCKGKLPCTRHSGQSDKPLGRRRSGCQRAKRKETLETTHRNCWNGS